MAAGDTLPPKPLILVRRPSQFNLFSGDSLSQRYTLLDFILDASSNTACSAAGFRRYLGNRAADIRLVICVSPSPLDADAIACLPSLECVIVTSAGLDPVDLAECRRRGIAVANIGGAFSEDVADFAVGLLIDVLRKISAGNRFVAALSWPLIGDFPLGSKLGGKRVGIVSLGSIGSLAAKRFAALGCKVAYTSWKKNPSAPYPFYDSIHHLANETDVLILSCALTDKTHHVVNSEVMSLLGARGVIINIGHGSLIEEKEMVRFMLEGKLGGAGLDVFKNEPDVPRELFGLDNVVLSPHRAVVTPESIKAMEGLRACPKVHPDVSWLYLARF